MAKIEVNLLKELIVFQHGLFLWYISFLKEIDKKKSFEINGTKLNSMYWIVAHLANNEDLLLAQALGKKGNQLPWLKKFGMGSDPDFQNDIAYQEVVKTANEIHINSLKNLDDLTDDDLKKDNMLGLAFGGDQSIKTIIMHHIRHVGVHVGHLSLLCKINGIKTA